VRNANEYGRGRGRVCEGKGGKEVETLWKEKEEMT